MAKVTGTMRNVVCVMFKGEGGPHHIKDDGGMVQKFLGFLTKNKIYTVIRGGFSGAGQYQGFFCLEDADKIRVWLEQEGVEIE